MTELAHPYPNSELASRFGCSNLANDPYTGYQIMESPWYSLPLALTSLRPEWSSCDVEVGARDPPRTLSRVPDTASSINTPLPSSTVKVAAWTTPYIARATTSAPDPIPTKTTDEDRPQEDRPAIKSEGKPELPSISPAKAADGTPATPRVSPNPDIGRVGGDLPGAQVTVPRSEARPTPSVTQKSINADQTPEKPSADPIQNDGKSSSAPDSDPGHAGQPQGVSSTSLPRPTPSVPPFPSVLSSVVATATLAPHSPDFTIVAPSTLAQTTLTDAVPIKENPTGRMPVPKIIPGDDGGTISSPSGAAATVLSHSSVISGHLPGAANEESNRLIATGTLPIDDSTITAPSPSTIFADSYSTTTPVSSAISPSQTPAAVTTLSGGEQTNEDQDSGPHASFSSASSALSSGTITPDDNSGHAFAESYSIPLLSALTLPSIEPAAVTTSSGGEQTTGRQDSGPDASLSSASASSPSATLSPSTTSSTIPPISSGHTFTGNGPKGIAAAATGIMVDRLWLRFSLVVVVTFLVYTIS